MVRINDVLAHVQAVVERQNGVNIDANVEDYHAQISLGELARVLGAPDLQVDGMLFAQAPEYPTPHVFIHPRHRACLERYPFPAVHARNVNSAAAAVEEVSHWVYAILHKQHKGRYASSLVSEFVGSLDKYFVLDEFAEEGMDSAIRRESFEAVYLAHLSPTYYAAHSLARELVDRLPEQDVQTVRHQLYRLPDCEVMAYLFNDLGLSFDCRNREEYDAVIAEIERAQ